MTIGLALLARNERDNIARAITQCADIIDTMRPRGTASREMT